MSEISSTRSEDGSASGSEESFASHPNPAQYPRSQTVTIPGAGTPLTKSNLAKNDSLLANELRTYQAPNKIQQLEAATVSLGFELPAKTKRQLLESYCEVMPLQRFVKSTENSSSGSLDTEYWEDLVEMDPLAAEIDDFCRVTTEERA